MQLLEHHLSAPLLVVMEITRRCNLHCAYCYNRFGSSHASPNVDLSLETLSELIDDISDNGVFEVNLSGGEPLLHPGVIQVIRTLNSKNLGFSIVSNGTMVTPEIAEALSVTGAIPNVQISFDSHIPSIHEKTRGLFNQAFEGFKVLVSHAESKEMAPSIGVVVNRFNYETICETIRFFSQFTSRFHVMNVMGHPELALDEVQKQHYLGDVLPMMHEPVKESEIGISLFDDRYRKLGIESSGVESAHINCLAGYTSLVVGTNLDVFPCDISRNVIGKWRKKGDLKKIYSVCQKLWFEQSCPWCKKNS